MVLFSKRSYCHSFSVKKADGTVFQDRDNHAWVNPYKEEAWEYLAEIALEAQKLGFDEIQFDYVRFCTGDPRLYGI